MTETRANAKAYLFECTQSPKNTFSSIPYHECPTLSGIPSHILLLLVPILLHFLHLFLVLLALLGLIVCELLTLLLFGQGHSLLPQVTGHWMRHIVSIHAAPIFVCSGFFLHRLRHYLRAWPPLPDLQAVTGRMTGVPMLLGHLPFLAVLRILLLLLVIVFHHVVPSSPTLRLWRRIPACKGDRLRTSRGGDTGLCT